MNKQTGIEWADATWNPTFGCTKVSAGCANCYAEEWAEKKNLGDFSVVRLKEHALKEPYKIKEPTVFFVNSMSDLFHNDIPEEFIQKVFKVMNETPWHTYLILTKRPKRMLDMDERLNWTQNIFMGVSVENRKVYPRIDTLRKSKALNKFLSLEPLLDSVHDIDLGGIDWVIVGGESGPKARPMKQEWVEEVHKACKEKSIAFFFKQWGGVRKWENGRKLNGVEYAEFPEGIRLKKVA
ncbi:DUF5131 family protein [Leptospira stimsonii]|uniref:Phage Gp37/Gp68 family protein n=1 Tax=Leptospira stimsonii TaxID=2202203 RepID=A0ABY2N9H0_9LEPT|nr:phage Gp37/Gp68 family protein [Leptospira stimsonii]TGK19035.1 phage Gp37/Gp68 family protein [Leptospira stimsonii]TGM18964.1 phage Gp37/Gp68 family protein [Leptospira stimsonii]